MTTVVFRAFLRGNTPKNRWRRVLHLWSTRGCATVSVLLGFYYASKQHDWNFRFPFLDSHKVWAASLAEDLKPGGSRRHMFNFVADIADQVSPAVVYIEAEGTVAGYPFATAKSVGSGFIVREDGLIITNAHTFDKTTRGRIIVKLTNGKEYAGHIEYIDRSLDLASIRIDAKGLPALKLANSDEARAGEWVLAAGSPLTLANSVTLGVISTTQRKLYEMDPSFDHVDYIQTDAAINIGNSGGPLVNLDGEVVGVNCMTLAVASGISFAIPSKYVVKFLEKADAAKKQVETKSWKKSLMKKPKLYGMTVMAIDSGLMAVLRQHNSHLPNVTHGLLIHSMLYGSAAYVSGLEPGDIITEVNDKPVSSLAELQKITDSAENVKLTVLRERKKLTISIHFSN